jgi:hypothetical protein
MSFLVQGGGTLKPFGEFIYKKTRSLYFIPFALISIAPQKIKEIFLKRKRHILSYIFNTNRADCPIYYCYGGIRFVYL